jgi:hypothetical protein
MDVAKFRSMVLMVALTAAAVLVVALALLGGTRDPLLLEAVAEGPYHAARRRRLVSTQRPIPCDLVQTRQEVRYVCAARGIRVQDVGLERVDSTV